MYNANDKIMRKTVLLLLFVTITMLMFVQCKKCKSKQLDDKNFTDLERQIIPYNGTETLVFKNLNGDSICFTGQGRTTRMNSNVEYPDHHEDECAGDRRNSESINVTFRCGNTDSTISIVLYFIKPFGEFENLKIIIFDCSNIFDNFYAIYGFYGDTILNTHLYYDCTYNYNYNITGYFNSLTLANKTYSNVYEFMIFNGHGRTLYYTRLQGIVGCKEMSGIIWYLDRIN